MDEKTLFPNDNLYCLLIILVGCDTHEAFKTTLYAEDEAGVEFYIIFSDSDQELNSSLKSEMLTYLIEHLENDVSVVTMSTDT